MTNCEGDSDGQRDEQALVGREGFAFGTEVRHEVGRQDEGEEVVLSEDEGVAC
jgi:hypothetical protein